MSIVGPTVTLLMTLLLSACSVFGVRSGYEQASYEVIDRFGENTEVRRYPPQLVAEAGVTASDEKTGRNQAFRMLFHYISGANRSQAKVAIGRDCRAGGDVRDDGPGRDTGASCRTVRHAFLSTRRVHPRNRTTTH